MMGRSLSMVAASLALSGCLPSEIPAPTSYHDCVLRWVSRTTMGDHQVASVRSACLGLFPQSFDWDAIARATGKLTWAEYTKTEWYKSQKESERETARNSYFSIAIRPYIHADFHSAARDKFAAEARLDP